MRYFNGEVQLAVVDVAASGFGHDWGQRRIYSNRLSHVADLGNGYNWLVHQWPYLVPDDDGGLTVVRGNWDSLWFDRAGDEYAPRYGANAALVHDAANQRFRLDLPSGEQFAFCDFSTGAYPQGAFLGHATPGGQTTEATGHSGDGRIGEVRRSVADGETVTVESFLYDYHADGEQAGRLQSVTLRRRVDGGEWTPIGRAEYEYYAAADECGSLGDLKRAKTRAWIADGWQDTAVHYYRYWKAGQASGFTHGLKFALGPESYARLAAVADPLAAGDGLLAQYADYYFEYDAQRRVTKEAVEGGTRTYTFEFTASDHADADNHWKVKTVETRPDGTQAIVFTNYYGQVLLHELRAGTDRWIEAFDYQDGRQTRHATAAAVVGYDEDEADLAVTLRASEGRIELTEYYTADGPGMAKGHVKSRKIQQGSGGVPIALQEYQYAARTAGGATVHPISQETVYRNADGTGAIVTCHDHAWHEGTTQMRQRVTTLPAVPAEQNGSGTPQTRVEVFDSLGNRTWEKDARGFIARYQYDPATGALTQRIDDVDTAQATDAPAGWTTPAGGGLHRTTDYQHDAQGRIIEELGPAHTAILDGAAALVRTARWTVYRDELAETWTAQGCATGAAPDYACTLVNPVTITKRDRDGRVTDEIQAVRTETAGRLSATDAFPQSSYVRWTTNHYGSPGQTQLRRVYHAIPASGPGASGTHYSETVLGFDSMGRQNLVRSPGGTITRTVFDARGLTAAIYIGTDDSCATPSDPTGNGAAGNNMLLVTENQYDAGQAGGNALLTATIQHADESTALRTDRAYDWRGRQTHVLTPAGVLTHTEYDNLDRATDTRTYAGSFTLDPAKLRVRTQNCYDDLGRVHESRVYEVDPSLGTVGSYLPSRTWYDAAGSVIKTAAANGLFQKHKYDSLGRVVASHTCFDADETAYADACNIADDTVIEQTRHWHDAAGNIVATATYRRLPDDDSTTGELTAANSYATASVVWHDAIGRPIATADYGREDVASGVTHYFFDGTTGALIDTNANGIPDVAEAVPPQPYTAATPGSLAGIDCQLQLVEYDSAGRAYRTIDNLGRINHTDFDAAGRTIRTIQNYDDGLVAETDTDRDITIEYQYDFAGRLATMTAYNPKGLGCGVQPQPTKYLYTSPIDASWQTAAVYPDSEDALSQNSVTKVWTIVSDNGDHVSTTYDRLGQVTSTTDQRGVVHIYVYNSAGQVAHDRVTSLGSSSLVDNAILRISTTYDDIGRVALVTSYDNPDLGEGSIRNQIAYEYNSWGRLAREYQEHEGAVDAATPFVEYTYQDSASGGVARYVRLSQVTYPAGREIHYHYSQPGAIDDTMSRLATIGDGTTIYAAYKYLGGSRIAAEDHADIGVKLDYAANSFASLDRFGRVIDQCWTNYAFDPAVVLDRYSYVYDRASNRTERINELNHGFDESYQYDQIDRLISAERDNDFDQTWTLDGLGNFSGFNDDGSPQSRASNAVNEITAILGGWVIPSYDRAGNMISGPKPADETIRIHYAFDAWNRLVAVLADYSGEPGDLIAQYQYDGTKRRVEKVVASAAHVHYFYNADWQLLEERFVDEGETIAVNQYVWSARYIDAPIVRFHDANGEGNTIRYYTGDANYNVTVALTAEADIANRYVYTAYGTVTVYSANWTNPSAPAIDGPLYCGYFFDAETGLYHVRNRYHDSRLSTFISRDPIEYRAGINLYEYVNGDPTNRVDPIGLWGVRLEKCGDADMARCCNECKTKYPGQTLRPACYVEIYDFPFFHAEEVLCRCNPSGCKPCAPTVGTIGFRGPDTHAHWPFKEGETHYNLLEMQQSPAPACRCFWKPLKDAVAAPPPGAVPVTPAQGGGPL